MTYTSRPDLKAARLSPIHVLRAEWLKLVTVRSTFWASALALVLAAATASALGWSFSLQQGATDENAGSSLILLGSTLSINFVALIVGVLGVLTIGSEYTTLQIRSTYASVPRRWPALVAKGIVVSTWSFGLGLIITFGSFGLLAILFGGRGLTVTFSPAIFGGLVGGAAYLAAIGVFAVALGALLRGTAAGIAVLTAFLFVVPVMLNILATLLHAEWASSLNGYLLSSAGSDLYAAPGSSTLQLLPATFTVAGWIAAAWALASATTLLRDV